MHLAFALIKHYFCCQFVALRNSNKRWRQGVLLSLLVVMLAACSDINTPANNSGNQAAPSPSVTPIAVTSTLNESNAPFPGTSFRLAGTGFRSGLDAQLVAGTSVIPLQLTIDSTLSLTVSLPSTVVPGNYQLQLRDQGQVAASLPFVVTAPLLVTGTPQTSVNAGDTLTLTGSGLQNVSASWNGTALTLLDNSETQIRFVVPTATSGNSATLRLQRSNTQHEISLQIAIAPRVGLVFERISAANNVRLAAGSLLTLEGNGFYGQLTVRFDDGPELIASTLSLTRATIKVPRDLSVGLHTVHITRVDDGSTQHLEQTFVNPILLSPISGLPTPGTQVTLNGGGFNLDTQIWLNEVALTPTIVNPTQLTFSLPANHAHVINHVRVNNGLAEAQLVFFVAVPVAFEALVPQRLVAGQRINILGRGFAENQLGKSQNNSSSDLSLNGRDIFYDYVSPTEISLIIPTDWTPSAGFAIAYERKFETTPSQLTLPTASLTITSVAANGSLTFNGANLTQIKQIRFGDQSVSVTPSSSNTTNAANQNNQLSVVLPANAIAGDIVFISEPTPGRVFEMVCCQYNISSNSALQIDQVQGVQTHLISLDTPTLRLVPHRELEIRVKLRNTQAAPITNPTVEVQAANDTETSQWLALTGPTTVPTTPVGDLSQNDLNRSYRVSLPARWLDTTLRLTLKVSANGVTTQLFKQPAIARPTYAHLHIVPLRVENPLSGYPVTPIIDLARIKSALNGAFPVEFDFTVEPTFDLGSRTGSVDDFARTALDQISAYRETQNLAASCHYFMGIISFPAANFAFTGGNDSVVSNLWYDAIADNNATGYTAVTAPLPHELGHNFGRIHSFDDPSFPKLSNGSNENRALPFTHVNLGVKSYNTEQGLTPNTVPENYTHHWLLPPSLFDTMSYGSTTSRPERGFIAMSHYTYNGLLDHALINLPASQRVACAPTSNTRQQIASRKVIDSAQRIWVQGRINRSERRATIEPLKTLPGAVRQGPVLPPLKPQSLYLKASTAGGATYFYPLTVATVDHDDEQSFSVAIKDTNWQRLEVIDSAQTVWASWTAPSPRLQTAQQNLPVVRSQQWQGSTLILQLQADPLQSLQVIYRSAARNYLLLDRASTPSQWRYDFSQLPKGGQLQVQWSKNSIRGQTTVTLPTN